MAKITRTIFTTTASAIVINDDKPEVISISVVGHNLKEKEIIKACNEQGLNVKAVYGMTETSKLYAMDEQTFIKFAECIGEGRI